MINFQLDEMQSMMQDSVSRYLLKNHDFDKRQAQLAEGQGYSAGLWKTLAEELGVLGATFPEALGGFDGGPVEMTILMQEFGRHLAVTPYLDSVVFAGSLLQASRNDYAEEMIAGIISGDVVVAAGVDRESQLENARYTARDDGECCVISGENDFVCGAHDASHLIVAADYHGDPALFVVEAKAPGVDLVALATIDGRGGAGVCMREVRLMPDTCILRGDPVSAQLDRAFDYAVVAQCAEMTGILEKIMTDTKEYLLERKQFGKPLSSFQALQFRLADMYMFRTLAESMMLHGLQALESKDPEDRKKAVSAAKVQAIRSHRFVGESAIQLHGAIGTTEELSLGHYFKRGLVIESEYGGEEFHLRRYTDLLS